MGAVTFGVPEGLALALRDALGYRVFVETGTYKGGTASWAARHFETVYSVEGYRPRFEKTAAMLAGQFKNLHLHYGDSQDVLARMLDQVNAPALIWLDAHWLGDSVQAEQSGNECPLREELAVVNAHPYAADHAILIDDARLFKVNPSPYRASQWPSEREVYNTLQCIGGRFVFTWQDVIAAVPVRGLSVIGRICSKEE